jgi:hypothetical protein
MAMVAALGESVLPIRAAAVRGRLGRLVSAASATATGWNVLSRCSGSAVLRSVKGGVW